MTNIETIITENIDVWTSALRRRATQGRGSSSRIELYGVQKLRELILDLAVRGLLVKQDPEDEPTSALLERISIDRERLINKKEIRRPRKFSEISDDEKFGQLPRGWEYVRLNDIGDWGAGATPRRSDTKLYGGTIPWFKSGELTADYISESEETVTEEALKKSSLRYNKVGDVLLAMYGATIGKTAILCVAGTTNQAVCACTPFKGIRNTYLLTLLKAYRTRFIGMGAGGAQPNISREKIIATVIALPPEREQERIVKKVDELMGLCDQLEEQQESSITAHQQLVEVLLTTLTQAADQEGFDQAWSRIAANFEILFTTESSVEQLKQTILQLAVMGRLVKQDPEDEPARVLLERLKLRRKELIKSKKIKNQKLLASVSEVDASYDLPESWAWTRLGNIAEIGPRNNVADSEKVSFVPMALILTGHKGEHGQEERFWSEIKRGYTHFANGDIALAKITPCFENSKAAIFKGLIGGIGAGTTELHVARPFSENFVARYILLYLKSPEFLSIGKTKMTGSAGHKRVPKAFFAKNPLPLPPLAEQKRIVKKVDDLFAICDQLKTQLRTAQEKKLKLADAITSQAVQ